MASPRAYFSLPPASSFQLPPRADPPALHPPPAGSPLASSPPFAIPPSLYTAALDVRVPVTVACAYAAAVAALSAYNRANGNRPWRVSRSAGFFWLVVAHNTFLAVYSAWTCAGMLGAMSRSVVLDWSAPGGVAGTLDSLCKMHGPRGFGDAVTFNPERGAWETMSPSAVMFDGARGPYSTDAGRIWNEGLGFYGWIFYISKFYEVLDSLIILAKGKPSSTLQTYHHAGVMLCMWAGIRYMSPPIWLFVLINSGIHTVMYTYYTLAALSVPVPKLVKQSITTMQIIQFFVGISYAGIHSFISYDIPVLVSSGPSEVIASASSSVASLAAVATSSGFADRLKELLFRAAAQEGLAESVAASSHEEPKNGHGPIKTSQITTHTELKTIQCLDTSGETFAIWLNILYLTPLTVLFLRFFVRSYLRRTGQKPDRGTGRATKHNVVEKASTDAVKGVERLGN